MSAASQREDISTLAIKVTVTDAENPDNDKVITLTRKVAFFGRALIRAGKTGLTRLDYPGFHIAHFVQMLREAGLTIHTEMEANSASWGGKHGRYRLMDNATFIKVPIPKKPKKKTPTAATKGLSDSITNGTVSEVLNEASI